MKIVSFTKIGLPYGWLGNMSRHPINHNGLIFKTCEHLFQSLRFNNLEIIEQIQRSNSPMGAKFIAKSFKNEMCVSPRTDEDVENMKIVIDLKINQHADVMKELPLLKDCLIIEDVTNRNNVRNRFWGMALVNGEWIGENNLGKIWMDRISNL